MGLAESGYKHDVSVLFSDFLSLIIACFSYDREVLEQLENRYDKGEQKKFMELKREFFLVHDREQKYNEGLFVWNDYLGMFYEVLSSQYKRSALGKFFTAESVCELVAKVMFREAPDQIVRINDAACGSGRLLLAGHCSVKGKCIVYGEDLDEICMKMTVINLLIHGVEGEVIHHNSLRPDSFYNGYYVNEHIKSVLFPTVRKLYSAEESQICRMWEKIRREYGEEEFKKRAKARKDIIKNAPHVSDEDLRDLEFVY